MSQTAIIQFNPTGIDPLPHTLKLSWHISGEFISVPEIPGGFSFLIAEFAELNVGYYFCVDFAGETDLSSLSPPVSVNVSVNIDSASLNLVINIEDFKQELPSNRAYFVLVSKKIFLPSLHYEYELKTIDQRYGDYKSWSESSPGVPLVINKPQKFTINAVNLQNPYNIPYNNVGNQKDKRLEILSQTLNNLGFNTAIPEHWHFVNGTMPAGMKTIDVNKILNNNGITKRQSAASEYFWNTPYYWIYNLSTPSSVAYFAANLTLMDFYVTAAGKSNVIDWVQKDILRSLTDYQSQDNVCYLVDMKLKDEPAWFLSELFKALSYEDNNSLHPEIQTFLNRNGLSVSSFRNSYLQYLKTINPDSNYWGKTQWQDVKPVGAGVGNRYINPVAVIEQQRLFYYTMIFFLNEPSNALIQFAGAITTEINKKYGTNLKFNIDTNQNNYFDAVYQGNLFSPFGGNEDLSWDGANMFYDYFNNGRINKTLSQQGHNCIALWFEDWGMGGIFLPRMSFYGDMMRSAAMNGLPGPGETVWPSDPLPGSPGNFGLYTIPFNGKKNPDEWQYRVMSFLGKGSKQVDYFMFGPAPVNTNAWSDYKSCYPKIAEINSMIGNAENVLYPGRPSRGKICILVTKCSDFYNCGSREYQMYQVERSNLHHALCHAGYSVDYIDEIDILQNRLEIRDYKVLYLTDPNLPADCAAIIKTWVHKGGILAVVAGAAVSDEFNNPGLSSIDSILGIQPREDIIFDVGKIEAGAKRDLYFQPVPGFTEAELQTIKLRLRRLNITENYTDTEAGEDLIFIEQPSKRILQKNINRYLVNEITTAKIPVVNPVTHLPLNTLIPAGGEVVETLCTLNLKNSPSPFYANALTSHAYGAGFGFAFSFYPGHQYAQSSEHIYDGEYDNYMPFNWIKDFRDLALIPVRKALVNPVAKVIKITKQDTIVPIEEPEVEVNVLSSDAGFALTLLNWQGKENFKVIEYKIILIIENPKSLSYSVSSAKGAACKIYSAINISTTQTELTIGLASLSTVDILSLTPVIKDVCNCKNKCRNKKGAAKFWCEMVCRTSCFFIKIYNNIGSNPRKGPASDGPDWTNLK